MKSSSFQNIQFTYNDVQKESIPGLSFSKDDVYKDEVSKNLRNFYLKKAEILGNNYKNKVKIIFKLSNGEIKRVYTTVWSSTPDYVSLKAGTIIPIRSILGIEF